MKKLNCGISLVVWCSFFSVFAEANGAETIPALDEIVAKVEKATMPTQAYSATIHQSVSHTNATTSPSMLALSATSNDVEEADYVVNCGTSGATRVTKGLSLKSAAQATNAASSGVSSNQNRRLMLIMNPLNALRHSQTIHSGTITNDVLQNIPCYKISASDGRFGFMTWISKADSYVCRQIILQDSNLLFDTQFEYTKWNGKFVPAHVTITKPENGTRVRQDFSGHSLNLSEGGAL